MITSIAKPRNFVSQDERAEAALPPEVKGWPLVGVLPALLRNPFEFLAQAREQYGDIYTLNLGMMKLTVLNHPRHAQHVLRDHAQNYYKGGAIWNAVRPVVGNGLVLSEGDFWLRQRRLMQPQFHRQRLGGLTHLMVEAIQEALGTWTSAAESSEPFNLAPALNALTMRVVVKTLFGTALSPQELDKVGEDMTYVLDYLLLEALMQSLPSWLPVPYRARYRRALARFDETVYRIIAQARRAQASAEEPANHLLAMLLDTVDEETGEGMTDRQLRDEVATLFLAGYETTSITLAWTFHHLAEAPDVMEKLQAEVDSVLGERTPTFADLPKLPYTRMVLQEALRLRPPSYWLPRTAQADDEIDGYSIPAGSQVASFTYMYHRHPDFWPDPERFDPERFSPEQSAGRHHFAWIPFGAGQRLCIGRDFALMEGALALAMIMQRYRVRIAPGHVSEMALSGTLRPKHGVMVHLSVNGQP